VKHRKIRSGLMQPPSELVSFVSSRSLCPPLYGRYSLSKFRAKTAPYTQAKSLSPLHRTLALQKLVDVIAKIKRLDQPTLPSPLWRWNLPLRVQACSFPGSYGNPHLPNHAWCNTQKTCVCVCVCVCAVTQAAVDVCQLSGTHWTKGGLRLWDKAKERPVFNCC